MTVYEPGTVAVATVRGVPNVRVAYADPTNTTYAWFILPDDKDAVGDWVPTGDVTNIRPLVVLDIDDPERLVSYLKDATDGFSQAAHGMDAWVGRQPIRDITNQIEAQSKRPRIPEPGLWGVVSTQNEDDLTDYWTNGPGGWFNERGEACGWPDLPNPVLIRDGIEDGAK